MNTLDQFRQKPPHHHPSRPATSFHAVRSLQVTGADRCYWHLQRVPFQLSPSIPIACLPVLWQCLKGSLFHLALAIKAKCCWGRQVMDEAL